MIVIVLRIVVLLVCIAATPLLFAWSNPRDDVSWQRMSREERVTLAAWLATNVLLAVTYLASRGKRTKSSITSTMTTWTMVTFILANAAIISSRTWLQGEESRYVTMVVVLSSTALAFLVLSYIAYNLIQKIKSRH
jgi:hypothetical protein